MDEDVLTALYPTEILNWQKLATPGQVHPKECGDCPRRASLLPSCSSVHLVCTLQPHPHPSGPFLFPSCSYTFSSISLKTPVWPSPHPTPTKCCTSSPLSLTLSFCACVFSPSFHTLSPIQHLQLAVLQGPCTFNTVLAFFLHLSPLLSMLHSPHFNLCSSLIQCRIWIHNKEE